MLSRPIICHVARVTYIYIYIYDIGVIYGAYQVSNYIAILFILSKDTMI